MRQRVSWSAGRTLCSEIPASCAAIILSPIQEGGCVARAADFYDATDHSASAHGGRGDRCHGPRFGLPAGAGRQGEFNPNQPRIPRGRSDGGRWTGDGEAPPAREPTPPADWDFWPQASTDDLPVVLANFDPPVPPGDEEPPKVPAERPKTSSERVAVLRDVARWMGRAARAGTAIGRAVSLASWLDRYNVVMQSYNDPPKSLEELQARVGTKNFGYDVHHIVEKAGAEADGYPRSMINDRDNLVLIPRMKHWELNAWYETRTRQFGMMTPRQYLRGKSWLERRQVGLIGLRKIKVMIDE